MKSVTEKFRNINEESLLYVYEREYISGEFIKQHKELGVESLYRASRVSLIKIFGSTKKTLRENLLGDMREDNFEALFKRVAKRAKSRYLLVDSLNEKTLASLSENTSSDESVNL
ncbi:hypothetical protein NOVO_06810 [Rickettsiales bacterium Ac37b]|nr:hypothetical protein NOVO_06810 [Rickettsiales bacterium Ac37b]